MEISHELLFSFFVILLLSSIAYLRIAFPNASKRAETIVVAVATVVFFGLGAIFLGY